MTSEGAGSSGGSSSGGSSSEGSSSGGSGPGGASTGGTGGAGAGVPCGEIDGFATGVWLVDENGTIVDDDFEVAGITATVTASMHSCDEGVAPLSLVDAKGKPWAFCVPTNGNALPVEVGQDVSFDFEDQADADLGEFYKVFALYDAMGSRSFFSSAGPARSAPGFSLDQGVYICGGKDDPKCIDTTISVIFTVGDQSIELGPVEVGTLGGFEFHVSDAVVVSDAGACDSNTGFLLYYFVVNAP